MYCMCTWKHRYKDNIQLVQCVCSICCYSWNTYSVYIHYIVLDSNAIYIYMHTQKCNCVYSCDISHLFDVMYVTCQCAEQKTLSTCGSGKKKPTITRDGGLYEFHRSSGIVCSGSGLFIGKVMCLRLCLSVSDYSGRCICLFCEWAMICHQL